VYFVVEHRLEQLPAEGFHRLHLGRFDPPHLPSLPEADRREDEDLELLTAEREVEGAACVPAWRAQHASPIPVTGALDQQIEIEVGKDGHSLSHPQSEASRGHPAEQVSQSSYVESSMDGTGGRALH
jgi:hypothetical protein